MAVQNNAKDFTLIWNIENFSMHCIANDCISSPPFVAESIGRSVWFLEFYPIGNEPMNGNYASLFLHRSNNCNSSTNINLDFTLKLIYGNGKTLKSSYHYNKIFEKGTVEGEANFIKTDEIIYRIGSYSEDILTVVCHLTCKTLMNWCKISTKIGVDRFIFFESFPFPIRNLSRWNENESDSDGSISPENRRLLFSDPEGYDPLQLDLPAARRNEETGSPVRPRQELGENEPERDSSEEYSSPELDLPVVRRNGETGLPESHREELVEIEPERPFAGEHSSPELDLPVVCRNEETGLPESPRQELKENKLERPFVEKPVLPEAHKKIQEIEIDICFAAQHASSDVSRQILEENELKSLISNENTSLQAPRQSEEKNETEEPIANKLASSIMPTVRIVDNNSERSIAENLSSPKIATQNVGKNEPERLLEISLPESPRQIIINEPEIVVAEELNFNEAFRQRVEENQPVRLVEEPALPEVRGEELEENVVESSSDDEENLPYWNQSTQLLVPDNSPIEVTMSILDDLISINIRQIDKTPCMVCKISLTDINSTKVMSKTASHRFSSKDEIWSFPPFLSRRKIEKYDNTLNIRDSIYFLFEISISNSIIATEPMVYDCKLNTEVLSMDSSSTLSKDLNGLLNSGKYADVIIKIREKKFSAHKSILSSRSPVFWEVIEQKTLENQMLECEDFDLETMTYFLEYLYTGRIDEMTTKAALKLLIAAREYKIASLTDKCFSFLTNALNTGNVIEIIEIADLTKHQELKDLAFECIQNNCTEILSSQKWINWAAKNMKLSAEIFIKLTAYLKNSA